MCRLAWQLLGMLGNVLGLLGMLRNVLGILCNVPGMLGNVLGMPFSQGPRSLTSKKNSPTCCLISYETKGVVYHQTFIYETLWYTTPLASQLIRQQVGGFFFDVRLLGPCEKGMPRRPRMLPSMPRTLQSMPRTLPSMPRSCQASLHI